MIFFTSDLHLGHANAMKHCARPFSSVEEMDEFIITNWNKRVHKDDTVYIVGDLTLKNVGGDDFARRLKGKKILICGNHDLFIRQPGAPDKFFAICMNRRMRSMLEWTSTGLFPSLGMS